MNWLDLIIIIFLVIALFRGLQTGFIQQFFSTLGFFVGIFLGAWAQDHLIDLAHSAQSKSLLSLFVITISALLFMTLGEFLGMHFKARLKKLRLVEKADRGFGAALGVLTILVAVWLGAAIFNNIPMVGLQQQIRGSRIIATLNQNLPSAPSVISKIGHFINPNGFPQVFTGLEPSLQSDAPLPELGELKEAVEKARPSIVKIAGEGCGGIVEGSGFIARDDLVITNAHVVAGVGKIQVLDGAGEHQARVIWFDPKLDLAVLRTNSLAGGPLELQAETVGRNTKGVVLGYPGGGGFTASPAVVIDAFTATGRDIYNQNTTKRSVYSMKADIRQGNSGGPLIAADGSVIGVIFAESTTYEDVGYALTMDQALSALSQAEDRTQSVATGTCAQ
jgi:S1-C subfamily serine protease